VQLKIKINQRLEILLPNPSQHGMHQYSSRVEEIAENRMSIAMPMSKGYPIVLERGKEFLGKIFDSSGVFGFKSVFWDKRLLPLPIWIVSMPYDLKKVQQRAFVRFDIALPVTLEYSISGAENPEKKTMNTISKDISGGGIQIISQELLRSGTGVDLTLQLSDGGGMVQVKGEVVRVTKPQADRPLFWIGIRFVGIKEGNRDKIIRFIFKKQLERRQKGL
jgi:c-di-GMP-binding flagellar brake protein YcgR